jgi:hypothetical protein
MTPPEKHRTNEHGTFTLRRSPHNQTFVCDRCLRPKDAKIQVEWTDVHGHKKMICNGCYGRLVSGTPL